MGVLGFRPNVLIVTWSGDGTPLRAALDTKAKSLAFSSASAYCLAFEPLLELYEKAVERNSIVVFLKWSG